MIFSGCSRKKRAPPPPPALILKESKMKSSTLPTSVTEERRNCSSFTTDTAFRHSVVDDDPVDATNTKVQSPVDHTSKVVNETKASKNEVPSALGKPVDVVFGPKSCVVGKCSCSNFGSFHWETLFDDLYEPYSFGFKSFKVRRMTSVGQVHKQLIDELKLTSRFLNLSEDDSTVSRIVPEDRVTVADDTKLNKDSLTSNEFIKYLSDREGEFV